MNRWAGWFLTLFVLLAQVGCTTLRHEQTDLQSGDGERWSGRFSLTRTGNPGRTERLTVSFELKGNAQEGELVLEGPLGARVARATWSPNGPAWLERGEQKNPFADLASLTEAVVGQPLPMRALFEWLHGNDASAPPWTVDLTQWANGRISARQLAGTESVNIVVLFEASHPAPSGQ